MLYTLQNDGNTNGCWQRPDTKCLNENLTTVKTVMQKTEG